MFRRIRDKLFSDDERPTGPVVGISQSAINMASEIAKESHPNEFIGVLQAEPVSKFDRLPESNGSIITSIAFIPGTITDETSATLQSHNIPTTTSYVGTVHSHPNGVLRPSNEDKSAFSRGSVHIIIGHPYEETQWQAYNNQGEPIKLAMIRKELNSSTQDEYEQFFKQEGEK